MTSTQPSADDTTALTDTSVMPFLHTMFRREFRLAAGLVRGVKDGDTKRARVVAAHLDIVGGHLHHHHTIEDRILWPLLLERVPEELAPIVQLMETQHQVVDAIQDEIAEVLPVWRSTAVAAARDQLAELLDRLYVHLAEHLDAEEQRLLPIAARCMSQEEWEHMGEVARREGERKHMLLFFGMYAYEGDPQVMAGMLADAPPPVRALLSRLTRRAFRKHSLKVYGTATP